MKVEVCPMCLDPKGKRWTEKVALGQRTVFEAAAAFSMSVQDVEEHIYKHDSQWSAVTPTKAYERDFYVSKLESILSDLQRWADEIMDGEPTSENIRQGTTLTKEIRDTLRLMGETTKILKDDEAQAAIAAVKQMQARYLSLTNIIVTQACPECKAKILTAIDEQKKLMLA